MRGVQAGGFRGRYWEVGLRIARNVEVDKCRVLWTVSATATAKSGRISLAAFAKVAGCGGVSLLCDRGATVAGEMYSNARQVLTNTCEGSISALICSDGERSCSVRECSYDVKVCQNSFPS